MIGLEGGSYVPVADFQYPDDGETETPVVRDAWVNAPLLTKCQQRFAPVKSGDVMTMPMLDKRLEVLRYALREAVEQMDIGAICRLADKARATAERISTEQLAERSPGGRELYEDILILDDAERGRVLVHFSEPADSRTRRWMRMCGFQGAGDGGATYWRRRTFRRGENIGLATARHCVETIVAERAKLAAAEHAEFVRETAHSICA